MVVVIDRVHVAPVILMWYDKYDITKYYATSCSYYQFLQNRTWLDLSPSSPAFAEDERMNSLLPPRRP